MDNQDDMGGDEKRKGPSRAAGPGLLIPLIVIALLSGLWLVMNSGPPRTEIKYSVFLEQLAAKNIAEVTLRSDTATGRFRQPPLLSELTGATQPTPPPRKTARKQRPRGPSPSQLPSPNGRKSISRSSFPPGRKTTPHWRRPSPPAEQATTTRSSSTRPIPSSSPASC